MGWAAENNLIVGVSRFDAAENLRRVTLKVTQVHFPSDKPDWKAIVLDLRQVVGSR